MHGCCRTRWCDGCGMIVGAVGTKKEAAGLLATSSLFRWLRGPDLNQRPSGYEPDELPDCSTPRWWGALVGLPWICTWVRGPVALNKSFALSFSSGGLPP